MYFLTFILILFNVFFSQEELSERYHSYEDIEQQLLEWEEAFGSNYDPYEIYPGEEGIIYHHEVIGYSEVDNLPIWGVKLSFNADIDEDEPKVLILGNCHAEEIYGVEISMEIIDWLLNPYPNHPSYLQLIYELMSKIEIWVVPTHNPDGLRMVHGYDNGISWIQDVYYRKNTSDANQNGVFDYLIGPGDDIDGVDLNRNYDFNWIFGDEFDEQDVESCNPSYMTNFDYYRGSEPFSESEVETIKNFTIENDFLLSVAYHSSRSGCVAEKVIYPWLWDGNKSSPDFPVISRLGEEIAQLIPKEAEGGHYQPSNSVSRKGNAHDWLYRNTGCIQYLIEVGTENIQPNDTDLIEDTILRNINGLLHLFKRSAGTDVQEGPEKHQITGIVTDNLGNAINAQVKILELDGEVLMPRYTNNIGRYRRLLVEGTYTLEVQAYGYQTYIHEFIPSSSAIYEHDVQLVELPSYDLSLNFNYPDGYDSTLSLLVEGLLYENSILVDSPNINFQLSEGVYTLTILGDSIFPEKFYIDLNNSQEINIGIKYEGVLFLENFDNFSNWDQNGNWDLDNSFLITRSTEESFYSNNLTNNYIRSLQSFSNTDVNSSDYILEISMKNELEWENDIMSIYLSCEGCYDIPVNQISNHDWSLHNLYIPVDFDENSRHLNIDLETDSTLNYRGVEIDFIKLLFKPEDDCYYGDVNLDAITNVLDVVLVVNFIFEMADPNNIEQCTADLNSDDIINVLDVVLIVDSIFNRNN